MKRKVFVSIVSVASVAVISGIVLWFILVEQKSLGQLGLISVFVTSMLSHLTVVARDMFVPVFLPLTSTYNPLVLGIAAGWGGAIGEVTTYFLGWGVAESLNNGINEADNRVAEWIKKYGLWAVLMVSITPLPDTPIVLLAGSSRLSFKKLIVVEGAGKTALYTLGAVVGGYVFSSLTNTIGSLMSSIIMVAASIAFCILVSYRKSRNLLFGWFEKLIP